MPSKIERGTLFIGGACHGPAERHPNTGTIEAGPHVTKRAASDGEVAVLRIDQSPLNQLQWQLSLACGHERWVTSKRKPTSKKSKCDRC